MTNEAHDDMHLCEVERTLPYSSVPLFPISSALSSHSVEHVDMQEVLNGDPSDLITARSTSPTTEHTSPLGDSNVATLDLSQNFIAPFGEDASAMVQHAVTGSAPGPAKDGVDS